jgi:hypothetical protein
MAALTDLRLGLAPNGGSAADAGRAAGTGDGVRVVLPPAPGLPRAGSLGDRVTVDVHALRGYASPHARR